MKIISSKFWAGSDNELITYPITFDKPKGNLCEVPDIDDELEYLKD